MNTTRTGMRTVLAAAAAGALIMGSAAGAMADETPTTTPKPTYIQLTKVDFHRHSPVDLGSTKARTLKVRATVRDTDKVKDHDPLTVTVTLAQYTKKGGALVLDKDQVLTPLVAQPMTLDKTKKNEKTYYFKLSKADLKANVMAKALADDDGGLVAGSKAYICIQSVDVTPAVGTTLKTPAKKQAMKKVNGGDCVKIVNKAPKAKKAKNS